MKKLMFISVLAIGLLFVGAGQVSAQTSVAGEWDASMNTPGGARPFKLVFKVEGEKLSGTAKRANGDVPVAGTVKGDEISFSYTIDYNGNAVTLSFTGKVKGDAIAGTVYFNESASDEWSAKRTPPPAKSKP
ncbi:MAG: hypothetical protein ABL999_13085 [Pyrinomonadaceae bacterium]